jgi:hypothetical protein
MIKTLDAIAVTLLILALAYTFERAREIWPVGFVRFRITLVASLLAIAAVLATWHFAGA